MYTALDNGRISYVFSDAFHKAVAQLIWPRSNDFDVRVTLLVNKINGFSDWNLEGKKAAHNSKCVEHGRREVLQVIAKRKILNR